MEDDQSPLCCCEYYNISNQRTHLLTFCCECDDFDKAVDDWFKGNPQTSERFSKIINSFTDRCRLPWFGGAQQFDTGVVFPPLILIISAYIACKHFVLTILVFFGLPVVVLCFYVITIRVKIKTRFFLSLSLTSTIGLFVVYFHYVAPSQQFFTNMLLVLSGSIMGICFYVLQKPQSTSLLTNLSIDLSFNQARPTKFCEDCRQNILPRAKHCRICKECVSRYDHHCVWTNCCIGGHNHRLFLCTVALYLINIVAGCYITFSNICDWNMGFTLPDCSHVYTSESTSLVFVCCCYAVLCGVALLVLLLQQSVLITFNITSYELRHMPSSNQNSCWNTLTSSTYNKGFLNNWSEFLKI